MGIILPIAVIVLSLLTVPAVVDIAVGEPTLPGDAVYGIERAGESIRSAFGVLDSKAIVNERIDEAIKLSQKDLPERAVETLDDADLALQNVPSSERADLMKRITDIRTAMSQGRIA